MSSGNGPATGTSAGRRAAGHAVHGSCLLSSAADGTIRKWMYEGSAAGQCIQLFSAPQVNACLWCVCFAADQDALFAGCENAKLLQWNNSSGEVVQSFDGHAAGVLSVCYLKEACQLFSGVLHPCVHLSTLNQWCLFTRVMRSNYHTMGCAQWAAPSNPHRAFLLCHFPLSPRSGVVLWQCRYYGMHAFM